MQRSIQLLLFIFLSFNSFSQKLITDTLYLNFNPDTVVPVRNYSISEIQDKRPGNKNLVSYTTVKRFLVIPVDRELITYQPLAKEIAKGIKPETSKNRELALEINYFEIALVKGRLAKYYQLDADLPVYSDSISEDSYLGTLAYSIKYKPSAKEKDWQSIQGQMMHNWHREFKLNLLTMSGFQKGQTSPLSNFLEYEYKRPRFLMVNAGIMIGPGFWQLEGELALNRPETTKISSRTSGIIRYMNTKDFESISFGKKSGHRFSRITENIGFDLNLNLLMGINRWDSELKDEITLYQLFNVSASSIQCLSFEKKNKTGFIAKLGLYENLYYIIQKPLGFQYGLYYSMGYKF